MVKIYNETSTVTAVDGNVVVDGPDGLAITLTPDAASAIAEQLREAARMARAQQSSEAEPPYDR